MSERSYSQSVEDMAHDILSEHGTDENNWHEPVHEAVDSSQWIIYTSNHEKVLEATDNEPEGDEVRGMSAADADWRDMRQTAAFLAMQQDVIEKIREFADEYEPHHFMLRKPDGIFLTAGELATEIHNEGEIEVNLDDVSEVQYDCKEDAEAAKDTYENLTNKTVEIVAFNESEKEINLAE